MLNCTCHLRQLQSRPPPKKIPRPASGHWQRTLGFMLDEKMFAFYYELSPNSR